MTLDVSVRQLNAVLHTFPHYPNQEAGPVDMLQGEDLCPALPFENRQTWEGHEDDALGCKDSIRSQVIEHLPRMWAN